MGDDREMAQDVLVELEASVLLLDQRRLSRELDQGIDALVNLIDLIGEPLASPLLDLEDLAATLCDVVFDLLDLFLDLVFVEAGMKDKDPELLQKYKSIKLQNDPKRFFEDSSVAPLRALSRFFR